MSEWLIVTADDYIGAVKMGKYKTIAYAPRGEFTPFVRSLMEDYPDAHFHCVLDQHLSDCVKAKIWGDKIMRDNWEKMRD